MLEALHTLRDLVQQHGYAALFGLLLLGIVGLPLPDETLLTIAGYLVARDKLAFLPTCGAAFLGSACGITLSYAIGRTLGVRFVHKYGPRFRITPDRMARVHDWFERFGKWALPIGYFVPGVRHVTALLAGASNLEVHKFCLFAYAGALVWTTLFISVGYGFGEQLEHRSRHALAVASATSALVVIACLVAYLIWRRRRRRAAQRPL